MSQFREPCLLFDQAGVGGKTHPEPFQQIRRRDHRQNATRHAAANVLVAQFVQRRPSQPPSLGALLMTCTI